MPTDDAAARAAKRHHKIQEIDFAFCDYCKCDWPCDAFQLVAEIARDRRRLHDCPLSETEVTKR